MPQVLSVQLLRYQYNRITWEKEKLKDPVSWQGRREGGGGGVEVKFYQPSLTQRSAAPCATAWHTPPSSPQSTSSSFSSFSSQVVIEDTLNLTDLSGVEEGGAGSGAAPDPALYELVAVLEHKGSR